MTRKEAMDKVRKLLALGQCEAANVNESAQAIARAQSLMDKFDIMEATLDVPEEPEEELGIWDDAPIIKGKRVSHWRKYLVTVLSQENGCYQIGRRRRAFGVIHFLVGKKSKVQIVEYLYKYCCSQIEDLTRRLAHGQGRSYANSFKIGCVEAIRKAIKKEKEALRTDLRHKAAADQDPRGALVVVNNAIAKVDGLYREASHFAHRRLHLSRGPGTNTGSNFHGRLAGQEAGQGIYPGQGSGSGNSRGLPAGKARLGPGRG